VRSIARIALVGCASPRPIRTTTRKTRCRGAQYAGERLVPSQHGGAYGWGDGLSMNAEADYVHDAFITWGWTEQRDYTGRFERLPSPLLSRNLGRHRPTGRHRVRRLRMIHFNPRIDFTPCPRGCRRQKPRFVDHLEAHVVDNLRYRPEHRHHR
jgi:putative transferase (TIGR04331 family)